MTAIKVQGWMSPLNVAEMRTFVGQIAHVAVGGEIRSAGTPWFELFRFARIRAVRERDATDLVCPNCGQSAQVALELVWELEVTGKAPEACELCLDGFVTDGGDQLSFRE